MKLNQLILSAIFAALTAAGILVNIPGPGSLPITLQTFFVFMAGLMLEPRYALFSQLIYMAVGLLGLPVFSGGGGIGYVLQPSFGFILGFCVSSAAISVFFRKAIVKYNGIKEKKLRFWMRAVFGMLLSIFSLYLFGVAYMYFILNVYLDKAATLGSLIFGTTWIFMLIDIAKFSIALPLCVAIQRRLPPA